MRGVGAACCWTKGACERAAGCGGGGGGGECGRGNGCYFAESVGGICEEALKTGSKGWVDGGEVFEGGRVVDWTLVGR